MKKGKKKYVWNKAICCQERLIKIMQVIPLVFVCIKMDP